MWRFCSNAAALMAKLLAVAGVTLTPECAGDAAAFAEQVAPLRAAAPSATRFVLVTATLPAGLYDQLAAGFPGIVPALGPGLHCSAPGASAADTGVLTESTSDLGFELPSCAQQLRMVKHRVGSHAGLFMFGGNAVS